MAMPVRPIPVDPQTLAELTETGTLDPLELLMQWEEDCPEQEIPFEVYANRFNRGATS